ncbi:MAG TPA: hypothetical protein VGW38_01660 [Chloroflexota bacterium]|nr:hypothetical protein [Chloroflexota bacterium]
MNGSDPRELPTSKTPAGAPAVGVAGAVNPAPADMTQAYIRAGAIRPEEGIRPTGPAAAAMLAATLGPLAMSVAHLIATAYQPFEAALLTAGRLLVPGGDSVGGYSGKELVALAVWLGGWVLLHWRLRRRQVGLTGVTIVALIQLLIATLLFWPPVTRTLAGLVR